MQLTKHQKWALKAGALGLIIYYISWEIWPLYVPMWIINLPLLPIFLSQCFEVANPASWCGSKLVNEGIGFVSMTLSYTLLGYFASRIHSLYLDRKARQLKNETT